MPQLKPLMDQLQASLLAAYPARKVVRDLKDFDAWPAAELAAGVYTLLCDGEGDFASYVGREAQLGTVGIRIFAQIRLPEKSLPSAIEDAEFAMVEEIKAFCSGVLPAPLDALYLLSWKSSGQVFAPYGWAYMELEAVT